MRATITSRFYLVSVFSFLSLLFLSSELAAHPLELRDTYPKVEAIVCEGTTNLALGKPAKLSSQLGLGEASLAVDGIIEGDASPYSRSTAMAHSGVGIDPNAWWEVDLEGYSELDSLKIFNRLDCCRSRLRDFYIFSSAIPIPDEATLEELQADVNIEETHFPGVVDSVAVIELDQFGRYVRIVLAREDPLHFLEAEIYGCAAVAPPEPCVVELSDIVVAQPVGCDFPNGRIEVLATGDSLEYSIDQGQTYQLSNVFQGLVENEYQVWVRQINSITCNVRTTVSLQNPEFCPEGCENPRLLSLGKTATLSSQLGGAIPSLGVDGDTVGFTPWNSDTEVANVVHTDPLDFQGWFEVDLDTVYEIKELVVYPRANCCPSHLKDFTLLISEQPFADTTLEVLVADENVFSVDFLGDAPLGIGSHINIPNGTLGQYVRIMSPDSTFIVLSELSVFGCEPEEEGCDLSIDSIQTVDVSDCGLSDGTVSVFPFADTLEYSIDGGFTFQDTNFFSGLEPGSYKITLRRKGVFDCFAFDSLEIGSPSIPIITEVNTGDPTSCSQADGVITIIATGDSLEFSIDGGTTFQEANMFTGLSGGVYSLVVRNSNAISCQASEEVALNSDTEIVVDTLIVTNPSDCDLDDGRVEVLAVGDSLQYSIDGGITYQDSNVFEDLASGSYFLAIRKDSLENCILVTPVTLVNPNKPTLDSLIVSNPTACISDDGAVQIFASGDSLEYSIDGGESFQDTNVFDSLSFGDYLVVVREKAQNACEVSDSLSLVAPNTTAITNVIGIDPSDCGLTDGSITIEASGDSLLYSIDGGLSFDSLNVFSGLDGGIYEIVVQEKNRETCFDSDSISLQAPVGPVLDSVDIFSPTECDSANGAITLFASGDSLEYSIDGGETFQDTNLFEGLPAGGFNVVVREVGSLTCIATDSLRLIPQNAPVIEDIIGSDPTDCGLTDGSITIAAIGDSLQYSIDGGLTFQDSNFFGSLDSGIYQILVSPINSLSCASTGVVELFFPNAPIIDTLIVSQPTDCNVGTGTVIVEAQGDSLEYSIDGGLSFQVSESLSVEGPGTYDVVVREVGTFSCIAVDRVEFDTLVAPTIDSVNVMDPSSCGSSDGLISVFATGDSLEYALGIEGEFSLTTTFSSLPAGEYIVRVREVGAQSCTVSDTVSLTAPLPPQIDSVITINPSDCGLEDGRIQVLASGTDLEVSIDNGSTYLDTNVFTGLPAAIYAIRVRQLGSETCVSTDTVELIAPMPPIIAQLSATNPTDCGVDDGTISINAEGMQLEYSIDSGATYLDTSVFTNLPSGIYYVLARELGTTSCVAQGQVVLTGPEAPEIIQVEVIDPQSCGSKDGSINIVAIGEGLEYSINGGETFQTSSTISDLGEGMYQVVVRNPNFISCVSDTMVSLTDSIWCGQITCVEPGNVALGKTVTSSGVMTNAALGVDGNTAGSVDVGGEADLVYLSPSADTLGGLPYYDINLGSIHNLEEIRVYPRADCCPEQLEDFFIMIGRTSMEGRSLSSLITDTTVNKFQYVGAAPNGEPIIFDLPSGTIGQHIRLTRTANERLIFSEIEAYGCGLGSPQFFFYSAADTSQLVDLDPSSLIQIYPNPFRTNFTIDLGEVDVEFAMIRLINALGQSVFTTDLTAAQSIVQVGNNLSPGMYWVEIQYGTRIEQFKIIKQR